MEQPAALTALAALAHPARLDVFRLLVQTGPAGLQAGVIANHLNLPPATLSFHLTHLRHAGLVTFRRHSRALIYRAEFTAMNALLAYLTENCCQGNAAACAPPPLQPKSTPHPCASPYTTTRTAKPRATSSPSSAIRARNRKSSNT